MIKIGLVAPFEGRYRALGYEVLYAVKLALHQRNQQGGVAGAMVELVALHDDDDPQLSAQQADKFAIDPDVLGVIGPFSPATLAAAAPAYGALGLPLVTPATCPPRLAGAGVQDLYCLSLDTATLAREVVAPLPGGVQAALLRGESDPFVDALAATGLRVLDTGVRDVAVVLGRAGRVDVALYGGDALSAAELLLDMRGAGIGAPLWGGPALARRQLPQIAGRAAAGACYAVTAPAFADLDPGSAFSAAYRAHSGEAPGPWAGLAYDAALILLDALARAIEADGAPTREGVSAQLALASGPEGASFFSGGRRAAGDVAWYCYGEEMLYPGQRQNW